MLVQRITDDDTTNMHMFLVQSMKIDNYYQLLLRLFLGYIYTWLFFFIFYFGPNVSFLFDTKEVFDGCFCAICLFDFKHNYAKTTGHKTWWHGVAWVKEEPIKSLEWIRVMGRLDELSSAFANVAERNWAWQRSQRTTIPYISTSTRGQKSSMVTKHGKCRNIFIS